MGLHPQYKSATATPATPATSRGFLRYVQLEKFKATWQPIPADQVDSFVAEKAPFMVTVLDTTYDPDNPATHDQPLARGPLYFDLDDDRDPAVSCRDACKVVGELEALGVDPECLDIYLSGGKGVHIVLSSDAFIDPEEMQKGIPDLHRIYLGMALDKFIVYSLDDRVYSGKRGRMWRQAGIPREKGGQVSFKVPVTFSELQSIQILDDYTKLCSAPRESIPRKPATLCPGMRLLFLKHQENVEKMMAEAVTRQGARKKLMEGVRGEEIAYEVNRLKSALTALDADAVGYDVWRGVGFALHDAGWPEGLAIWEDWSASRSQKHRNTAKDCDGVWNSLDAGSTSGGARITLGSVFMWATDAGWADPSVGVPPVGSAFSKFKIANGKLYRQYQRKEVGDLYICQEVRIVRDYRDTLSESWGVLIEFADVDGKVHRVPVPANHINVEFTKHVVNPLTTKGLRFNLDAGDKKVQDAFRVYLNDGRPDIPRGVLVDRLGWHGDCYILGDGHAIGQEGAEPFVLRDTCGVPYSSFGTLKGWQDSIVTLAAGNSRLIFGISAALAGPMLHVVGSGGGGFNLRGASSIGKSTILRAAASVWGASRDVMHQWRATDNGLEGIAARHNDSILVLDEVSEMDPKKLEATLYMLANGGGKVRAMRDGGLRDKAQWKVLMLSSGEESTASALASIDRNQKGGAEIRLADFPADAGQGFGCWEHLHGYGNGAEFSDRVNSACAEGYGTAGPAFLAEVVKDVSAVREYLLSEVHSLSAKWLGDDDDDVGGQVRRVAARFALVGAVGDLAISVGVIPLVEGAGSEAAGQCFRAWLSGRETGKTNSEDSRVLDHVARTLTSCGISRFAELKNGKIDDKERIYHQLIGYIGHPEKGFESKCYLVPAANMPDILGPFDKDRAEAVATLVKAGKLLQFHDQATKKVKPYKRRKLPGSGACTVYCFPYHEGGEEDDAA